MSDRPGELVYPEEAPEAPGMKVTMHSALYQHVEWTHIQFGMAIYYIGIHTEGAAFVFPDVFGCQSIMCLHMYMRNTVRVSNWHPWDGALVSISTVICPTIPLSLLSSMSVPSSLCHAGDTPASPEVTCKVTGWGHMAPCSIRRQESLLNHGTSTPVSHNCLPLLG